MSHVLPGTNSGAKKGNPWIWSQCVWVIMRCPSQRGPADNSAWPNPWAPVPQSRTISAPSSPRTSTHDVLPPWRSVIRPGLAKDPRVPQNRTSILYPRTRRGCCTEDGKDDAVPPRLRAASKYHNGGRKLMSVLGHKRTYAVQKVMSALPRIATAKADSRKRSCLLYSQKRTCAVQTPMSALGQKPTCAVQLGCPL